MSVGDAAASQLSHLRLIEAHKWNSALFTTFPLSLSFFEAAPLIKLRAGNCRQISVLADVQGYAESLGERGATGAGRSFELRPVVVKGGGCFHPKVCLLLGAEGPRALVGSGNLTFTGWGRNLEFADYLCPAHSGAALRDLGNFFEGLLTSTKVIADFGDLTPFIEACQRTPESGATRLVHDLQKPIFERLVDEVDAEGGARALKIVSPYYGSGDGVLELADWLGVDDVSIFVCRQTREAFPEAKARAAGLVVKHVGSPILDDKDRPLHGKAIEIETKSGRRILLTGSVNVTKAALIDGRNVELAVLRILDGASHFGWKPSDVIVEVETASFEGGVSEPVITASFAEGAIKGRVFWTGSVAGRWDGAIVHGVKRTELASPAEVSLEGEFIIADDRLGDLAMRGGALQIELRRGAVVARGWILLTDYLAAVRERGGLAEAVFRVIAGTEDANDLETILAFAASDRRAFVRADRALVKSADGEGRELENSFVGPGALAPRSVEDASGGALPGSASAFDRLLQMFRTKTRSSQARRPASEKEGEEPDDEAEEGKEDPTQRPVRGEYFERFFSAFETRIREAPEEADRRHDLETLLGFIRFFADRLDDGDLRRSELQGRWLRLVSKWTLGSGERIDDIDAEYALGVCVRVLADHSKAVDAHGELQRHWNGPTPGSLMEKLGAVVARGSGSQWAPFATERVWRDAIKATLTTPTQWQNALVLREALLSGELGPAPPGFAQHKDLAGLRSLVQAGKAAERLVPLERWSNDRAICPSCNMVMSAEASGELRHTRLTRCHTPRCGRFIISLNP